MIVVDASLAAKWMLWEEDSPDALNFLNMHSRELCGPDLVFVEVAQAIVRRANADKSLHDDALRALDKWTVAWTDHVLTAHRITQIRLQTAGEMALGLGHPLADCIYLALVMELNCELATCDIKFAEKAAKLWSKIRLLRSYSDPSLH